MSYEPYIHINTGERAMIPVYHDPTTGARTLFAQPPLGFLSLADHPDLATSSYSICSTLARCLPNCASATSSDPFPAAAASAATTSTSGGHSTPDGVRRHLAFDGQDDGDEDAENPRLRELSTKALSTLSSKLNLQDIPDYLDDITAAVGRVDPVAHELITSTDWRALLASASRYREANKRITFDF